MNLSINFNPNSYTNLMNFSKIKNPLSLSKTSFCDTVSFSQKPRGGVVLYPNGRVKTRTIFDGKTKSIIKEMGYYENGQLEYKQIYYPKTDIVKRDERWYEDGTKMSETLYDKSGKMITDTSWYQDGGIKSSYKIDSAFGTSYQNF